MVKAESSQPEGARPHNPKVGDGVTVSLGLDDATGRVIQAYGEGADRRVVVELTLPDGESATISLKVSSTRPAAEGLPAKGGWMVAYQYEQMLKQALIRRINSYTARTGSKAAVQTGQPDGGYDFKVELGNHHAWIEVKHYNTGQPLQRKSRQEVVRRTQHLIGPILIVSNRDFPVNDLDAVPDRRIAAVTWRSPKDDSKLWAAIDSLIEGVDTA